jgi:hypothetical protein
MFPPAPAQFLCDILRMDSYGNATFDEKTKSAMCACNPYFISIAAFSHFNFFASYDATKIPNDKEKDERSRQKSRVFSKLLEALSCQEIEGQKSRKESVQTAVQGLVRMLERGIANEAEKESTTGMCFGGVCVLFLVLLSAM